jgi:hypothetical protein
MYLQSLTAGFVLTYRDEEKTDMIRVGFVGDRGDNDKWTLECGDESDTVAIKLVLKGQYLTCDRRHGGRVFLRNGKDWWKITHRTDKHWPPGSYAICPVDSPKYYLNVAEGSKMFVGYSAWASRMYEWGGISCSRRMS